METVEKIIALLEKGNHKEALQGYRHILNHGSGEERYVLGEEFLRYGFVEEAKNLFETLLQDYPDEGEILVYYAEACLELGEDDEAMLALNEVPENDPSYPRALLLMADLYQMQGLYEVSEQKLLKAKQLLPDEIVIDFALGELYLEEGKLQEAIEAYKKVIEKETEIGGVNIHQRLGDAYSAGGNFEEALIHYDKALEERLDINTLFNYGLTAFQAGMHKTAIEKFTEVKELDYEYHSVYLYLAMAYEREGELEKGLAVAEEGLKYDEFNKDLYFCGGRMALKNGDDDKGIEFLKKALELDPEFVAAALLLSKLYLKKEWYEDVLAVVKGMRENGLEEPQFLWDEAAALWHLEQYSQALNKYEQAYTYFKDDPDFLTEFGYFLMEEGKREKAAEIFTKVLEMDPTNENIIYILERLSDEA